MMLKQITALLFFLLLIGATEAAFEDQIDFPTWSAEAIEIVKEAEVMKGFGDGTFRPNQNLNRAEAVTLLLRSKKLEEGSFKGISKFADVPGEAWFARAVALAEENGWLTGKGDGRFHPADNLNRAEFAALIERAFELLPQNGEPLPFEDVAEGQWFYNSVKASYDRDLLRNARNQFFEPEQPVSRAEAAWVFAQILSKPGLNGTAGSNDFSTSINLNTREVATKPRDFNPNKQSVETQKKELTLEATPYEESVVITKGDVEWATVGSIRLSNYMEGRTELTSLNVRLRFDESDVGPEESFEARLHGPAGFEKTVLVDSGGNALFPGIDISLSPDDQKVYWVSYRPEADTTFFPKAGSAMVILNNADGLYYEPFSTEDGTRHSDVRPVPLGYESREIGSFEFQFQSE